MATSTPTPALRAIDKTFLAASQSEGAGARVRRSIGTRHLRNFTPFLMLDHFTVTAPAGFPDHPHRGQETITYLLSGAVDHEDFAGNKGTIGPGDLQFMTAGRGIVHAEMPAAASEPGKPAEPAIGMQLWVDLPSSMKTVDPRYRDLRKEEIPTITLDNERVTVKIISGESHGTTSVQELAYTDVWLLDVTIRPGGSFTQNIPEGYNAFAYVLDGADVIFGPIPEGDSSDKNAKPVPQFHISTFKRPGEAIAAHVPASSTGEARFILVAGEPLDDQPIVQYGPFVLDSPAGVEKAMIDFQTSSNGFERARGWHSEIGGRV